MFNGPMPPDLKDVLREVTEGAPTKKETRWFIRVAEITAAASRNAESTLRALQRMKRDKGRIEVATKEAASLMKVLSKTSDKKGKQDGGGQ
jgi:hypothetical protein